MSKEIILIERVAQAIFVIRGQKVMLDADLAVLYGIEARVLNQAVKRNADRFPTDFMFQLSGKEMEMVSQYVIPQADGLNSSQIVMSLRKHRGKRYRPHDEEIGAIIETIRQLMAPPEKSKREIGFHVREMAPPYRTRKVR